VPPLHLEFGTLRAVILISRDRVSAIRPHDDPFAFGASRGFELRRIGEFAEIVCVRSTGNIIFRIEVCPAFLAVDPVAAVVVGVVVAAESVSAVIAITTVLLVGEHHIVGFVVTDPFVAAPGLRQILGLAAKAAAGRR
jgi:hypothetical protein